MATKSFNQTLVANGASNGLLTVTDSSGFEVGATVFLAAKDERIRQLKIASKPTSSTVIVATLADAEFDASAFTVAKQARLFQPREALLVPSAPGNVPLANTLITSTTTISVPSNPELVLNGDTGNVLVIKKNNVEKASIDVDGFLTAAGIKFPDNTTQTTASAGGGGGGGGSGWSTAKEIDFTALSNQTLSSNTNYTIADVQWTYFGASYAREATEIVNGKGLVLKPGSNSVWWPPNGVPEGQSPTLEIDLPTLVPTWHAGMALRVWVYWTFSGVASSGAYQQVRIGVEARPSTSSRTTYNHLLITGADANHGSIFASVFFDDGLATVYEPANNRHKPYASDNVGMMVFPNGVVGGPCLKAIGTWNSGWPSISNMSVLSYDESRGTKPFGYLPQNKFWLHLGAMHQVTSANSEFVIKRIKIEVKDL